MRGPMGMRGAVTAVFSWDLVADGSSTVLRAAHQAFGDVDAETREGYAAGWLEVFDALRTAVA
jgi:hypothetical protein